MLNVTMGATVYVFRIWQFCLYSVYVFVGFTNKIFSGLLSPWLWRRVADDSCLIFGEVLVASSSRVCISTLDAAPHPPRMKTSRRREARKLADYPVVSISETDYVLFGKTKCLCTLHDSLRAGRCVGRISVGARWFLGVFFVRVLGEWKLFMIISVG
jgi:hypothetical protein